jgi:hypothetical protein
VIDKLLSEMFLLMLFLTSERLSLLLIVQVCVFIVWFFLWLPEEVLALLFLLHRENGDFSILMKDTSF